MYKRKKVCIIQSETYILSLFRGGKMNDQLPYDVDIQLAENENVEIDVSHSDANEFEHKRELLKKTKLLSKHGLF